MVIRNGNLSLVVEDTTRAIERATQLAQDMGGYVVSSRTWQDGKKVAGTIAIRVPAELFSDALKALRAMAAEVVTEEVSSQDVTEQYVDLSSRLRSLEATEEQLLKVMQKATQVNDVLSVQRELTKVQGEIEQTKGRMQYLERSSATSLIQVSLREVGLDIAITTSTRKARVGEEIRLSARVAGGFPPYAYHWDLGDGTTSTEETPAHTYSQAGKFDVSLVITDDRGNTATATIKELIAVAPMEVKLDASRTKVRVGEEIRFSARMAGGFPPYTYRWGLGDGTTSTEETPEHAYSQAGKFDVSLSITDDKGNTATATIKELIIVAPMEVQFDTSRTEVEVGQEVRFTSQVAGGFPPYAYRWDLGDGTTSTERNRVHIYGKAGGYSVSLTVTDDKGNTTSEAKRQLITVTAPPAWSAGKEATGALRALSAIGRWLATGLIWMLLLLPLWGLVLGVIIAAAIRRRRSS